MGPVKKAEAQESKEQRLSYEELNEACAQLYQQNQVLTKQVYNLKEATFYKRLDYIFEVLKYSECFKEHKDFIKECVDEVVDTICIKREEKGDSNSN
jgi:hypothetical protein